MRKDALTTALSADSTRSCRKQGRTRAKKRDGIYLPVSRLPEEAEELAMKYGQRIKNSFSPLTRGGTNF